MKTFLEKIINTLEKTFQETSFMQELLSTLSRKLWNNRVFFQKIAQIGSTKRANLFTSDFGKQGLVLN